MKPEQITALALDEVAPEERAVIEATADANPTLRDEISDTQMFCKLLTQELSPGEDTGLTARQRAELEAHFTAMRQPQGPGNKEIRKPHFTQAAGLTRIGVFRMVGMAACVALALFLTQRAVKNYIAPSETVTVAHADQSKRRVVTQTTVQSFPEQTMRPLRDQKAEPSAIVLPESEVLGRDGYVAGSGTTGGVGSGAGRGTGGIKKAGAGSVVTIPPPPPTSVPFGQGEAFDIYAGTFIPKLRAETLSSNSDFGGKAYPGGVLKIESAEKYQSIRPSILQDVRTAPLSTFSIDVDTASYANVRRFLNEGRLPPPDAVRLEELINYFPYSYEQPAEGKPFAVTVDVAEAPWNPQYRLARIALKGRDIARERVQANFVFLVDVSGSMADSNKLPLVKQSLQMLTEQLQENDRVSIVTYAGESGVLLPSTTERKAMNEAIASLNSGGSTNGASGISLAYEQAQKGFIKEGINRVILCTDGDFNVGISSVQELEKLITEKAGGGVFLSVLGFGTGNLRDDAMETLADKGNGNYAYIDSLSEARKVLVEQMQSTLVTLGKDVKIQVEFNPAQVASYRLIGYENRLLAKEDFNDDAKDAGEVGAGHTVTALYEIVPASLGKTMVDDLKYQAPPAQATTVVSDELLTVKLRYKQPEGDRSELLQVSAKDSQRKLTDTSEDFQFASAVAGFGMLLKSSPEVKDFSWEKVRELALKGKGADPQGYRGEFIQLVDKARGLANSR
jgi:secreted protein with Ig-like and vWFA domain